METSGLHMHAHKCVNTHAHAKGKAHPGFRMTTLSFVDMENKGDCVSSHCCVVGMRGYGVLTRRIWVTYLNHVTGTWEGKQFPFRIITEVGLCLVVLIKCQESNGEHSPGLKSLSKLLGSVTDWRRKNEEVRCRAGKWLLQVCHWLMV